MGLGLLATLLIVLGIGPSEPAVVLILGLVFSVGNLAYALLQSRLQPARWPAA
jgi:hypothetical protein